MNALSESHPQDSDGYMLSSKRNFTTLGEIPLEKGSHYYSTIERVATDSRGRHTPYHDYSPEDTTFYPVSDMDNFADEIEDFGIASSGCRTFSLCSTSLPAELEYSSPVLTTPESIEIASKNLQNSFSYLDECVMEPENVIASYEQHDPSISALTDAISSMSSLNYSVLSQNSTFEDPATPGRFCDKCLDNTLTLRRSIVPTLRTYKTTSSMSLTAGISSISIAQEKDDYKYTDINYTQPNATKHMNPKFLCSISNKPIKTSSIESSTSPFIKRWVHLPQQVSVSKKELFLERLPRYLIDELRNHQQDMRCI